MSASVASARVEFLDGVRSIAVVGVSSRRSKFGAAACRELKQRGFEVYPLHPSLDSFEDGPCYRTPADLPTVPDLAVVAVKSDATEIVRQLSARGIKKVWFQQGHDFAAAVEEAGRLGMSAVQGRCILMYAGRVTGVHRFHRFLSRLFGKY